jgi:hypothetical protein
VTDNPVTWLFGCLTANPRNLPMLWGLQELSPLPSKMLKIIKVK